MHFHRTGNKLHNDQYQLLICSRKNPSNLPKYYLINTRKPKGDQYISSLYRVSERVFRIEAKGKYYLLTIYADSANLSAESPKWRGAYV